MAKNRKKKADKTDSTDDKSTTASSAPASAAAAASTPATPAEALFAKGNFAAVHALAKKGDESAKKLLPLTTVDIGQVACGIVALAIVLTICLLTFNH